MPELRSRETNLRNQLDALAAQLVDREVYLQLATGLEDFLAQLRNKCRYHHRPRAAARAAPARQRRPHRPERILIRHSIPAGGRTTNPTPKPTDDEADEEPSPSSPLRWRSQLATMGKLLSQLDELGANLESLIRPLRSAGRS
jgi:site-specific DNA recombinase